MPDLFVSQDGVNGKEIPAATPKNIQGSPHKLFSAFCLYPNDVDFETKDDKEKIVLLLRQHPITNVKWIVMTLILLTGPTLMSFFGVFALLPTGFSLVISLAWYLITSAYAIEGFFGWYFNVYFITTERVIDVDFYNLINKKVSDAEIEKIQDISYEMGGVTRTMFNFGDVTIQTASEIPEFHFEGVPDPEKVVKILDDLRT